MQPLKELLAENPTPPKSPRLKLLIFLLRPFLGSRLLGYEQLMAPADAAIIFVCNHGEVWGPVTTQGLPFNFRPWVHAAIALPSSSDYVYENSVKKQKWLPAGLRRPCARFLCGFLKRLMNWANAIPIYIEQGGAIVKTFRQSLQSMEAGEPLLIFPEDARDENGHRRLYLREGVDPLSVGFVHLARLYYLKSGKLTLFVPLYANKKQRTISCGQGLLYDPQGPENQEETIARQLHQSMLNLYEESQS